MCITYLISDERDVYNFCLFSDWWQLLAVWTSHVDPACRQNCGHQPDPQAHSQCPGRSMTKPWQGEGQPGIIAMVGGEAADPVSLTEPLTRKKLRVSKCRLTLGIYLPQKLIFPGVVQILLRPHLLLLPQDSSSSKEIVPFSKPSFFLSHLFYL